MNDYPIRFPTRDSTRPFKLFFRERRKRKRKKGRKKKEGGRRMREDRGAIIRKG